jgi:hypothetical protein
VKDFQQKQLLVSRHRTAGVLDHFFRAPTARAAVVVVVIIRLAIPASRQLERSR